MKRRRFHRSTRAALRALEKSENWQWADVSNASDDELLSILDAAYAAWTAAIAKLQVDPNTPLPELKT